MQYVVERINQNYALQIVANAFLANLSTSSTFATILINFLLGRMEEMGCKLSILWFLCMSVCVVCVCVVCEWCVCVSVYVYELDSYYG